jgi:mannosyltransferase
MRIVFDNIIFFLQNTGGISNYWYQMLIRFDDNSDIKFYSRSNSKNIFYKLLDSKFNKFNTTNFNYPLLIDRFLDLKSNLFNSNEKFIFHSSYYRINKNKYAINIITVHDFIHEKFYSGIRRYISLIQKRKAIYKADLIITVSNSTKKDLLEIYPDINPNIIKVVYNGVSDNYFQISGITYNDDTLLYLGAREEYKNFHSIVKILSNLVNYKLVIVGPQLTKLETNFLNRHLKNRWSFFTKVPEKKLNAI